MKKVIIDYILVILICYSIIEFLTIAVSTIFYKNMSLTDTEAVFNSKITVIEIILCILIAFIYNESVKK